MPSNNIKNIDISKEEPINIVRNRIKNTYFNTPIIKEDVVFNKDKFEIASLIFNLQDTGNKYGIKFEMILVLLYLNELMVFMFTIEVLDRNVKLTEYVALGFVAKDLTTSKKNYYRITNYGKEVVEYFYSTLNNVGGLIGENRVLELDAKAKLKSVLADYYAE